MALLFHVEHLYGPPKASKRPVVNNAALIWFSTYWFFTYLVPVLNTWPKSGPGEVAFLLNRQDVCLFVRKTDHFSESGTILITFTAYN